MTAPMTPVRRNVIGTPDSVGRVLEAAHQQGRLLSVTPPRTVDSGRVAVSVLMMVPTDALDPSERPVQPRSVRHRNRVRVDRVTAVSVALSAVGVALAAVISAAAWLVSLVLAHLALILGALVALVVLALVVTRSAGVCCPGIRLHCAGCGHGA
jgi:hypothetical protein